MKAVWRLINIAAMLLIRNILLYCAVGIALLHSLIPHLHHGEMTNVEHYTSHENAIDFVDYLGLAFQHGTKDKLNYISTEQKSTGSIDLDYLQGCAGINTTPPEVRSTSKSLDFSTQSQLSFYNINASSDGLRGPPVH